MKCTKAPGRREGPRGRRTAKRRLWWRTGSALSQRVPSSVLGQQTQELFEPLSSHDSHEMWSFNHEAHTQELHRCKTHALLGGKVRAPQLAWILKCVCVFCFGTEHTWELRNCSSGLELFNRCKSTSIPKEILVCPLIGRSFFRQFGGGAFYCSTAPRRR